MTRNEMKQAVESVAKDMCQVHNGISTKRLKIELRNRYPADWWSQYETPGGIPGVSDLFHELVREGKFVSIHDNGTYQTYADPNLYIPMHRKGDAFIATDEAEPASMPQMNTSTVGASLVNALSAASTLASTVVTAMVKKVKKATSPKTRISRHKALELMQNSKGKFFTVTFDKKPDKITGKVDERTINAQYMDYDSLGYVVVKDLVKKAPRNVNLQTIKSLRINGQSYKIQ